jgi:hypothetical protein
MKTTSTAALVALGLGWSALIAGSNSALAGAAGTNQVKAPNAGWEQALKLLDQYATTMSRFSSFIMKSKGLVKVDAHYTAGMDTTRSGRKTRYDSEEFRFDGTRFKICLKEWGARSLWNYPQDNPLYSFRLWDGTNGCIYQDDPRPRPATSNPMGSRYSLEYDGYHRGGHTKEMMAGSQVYYLLGYFPITMPRIDMTFRQASAISVRGKTELVDGSPCFVIDAVTKCGRGSVWLDPQHGYLIAKAEYHIRPGDFLDEVKNRVQPPGKVTDMRLYGIRFKKLNDTWVTVAGTEETRSTWPPDGYEDAVRTDEISEIIVQPDFSTLTNAFALEDVHEGAWVKVWDKRNLVWRNGKIQVYSLVRGGGVIYSDGP